LLRSKRVKDVSKFESYRRVNVSLLLLLLLLLSLLKVSSVSIQTEEETPCSWRDGALLSLFPVLRSLPLRRRPPLARRLHRLPPPVSRLRRGQSRFGGWRGSPPRSRSDYNPPRRRPRRPPPSHAALSRILAVRRRACSAAALTSPAAAAASCRAVRPMELNDVSVSF